MRRYLFHVLIITAFLGVGILSIGSAGIPEAHGEMQAFRAAMEPGKPPENNPHPPQTMAEKRRVDFALEAARLHLGQPLHYVLQGIQPPSGNGSFQSKDLNCLKSEDCYGQDSPYLNELIGFHDRYGELVEVRFAHVIPWSWEKFQSHNPKNQNSDPNVIIEAQTVSATAESPAMAQTMTTPQLQSDEFMVHAYVKFSKETRWYHLDIILTENSGGEIGLRHFFTVPIPPRGHSLPPGVVC